MKLSFKLFCLSCFVTCFFLFASCDRDCTVSGGEYRRTVIAYIGRDNNLTAGSEDKVQSMLEGWDGRNGNLIIYQDTAAGNPGLMEVYREKGGNKIKTVREYANENSADPGVFKRVLNDAVSLYPADSYGLIIFSHASGWLPEAALVAPRSFITDHKDEMGLADMAAAIPDGCFDFIVFETCFSAGIEVAYELKEKTGYIIASSAELLSPGFKEIYASSLNCLFEKEPALETFTRNIFTLMSEEDTSYFKSATLSLIKTEKLYALGAFLRQYIDREKINAVNLYDVQHFDRYSYRLFFDFEDYYSRILSDNAPEQELKDLLNECVPYKDATPSFLTGSKDWMGFDIKRHSGLTTYIEQEYFPYLNQEYRKSAWYRAAFN